MTSGYCMHCWAYKKTKKVRWLHFVCIGFSVRSRMFESWCQQLLILFFASAFGPEVEKYDENIHEKTVEQGGTPTRYYFENLKISIPQIKLSVFTSNKLPLDLKVSWQLVRSQGVCVDCSLSLSEISIHDIHFVPFLLQVFINSCNALFA